MVITQIYLNQNFKSNLTAYKPLVMSINYRI